jgi:Tfp pilus assembly protein PilF
VRRVRAVALAALAALALSGCGRMPQFVVLNDPLTAEEHVQLGVGYERQGELFLAEKEYGRALRKDPRCFQARVNLGNVALSEREYLTARKQYLKALEIRPGDPEATNNLAMAALRSGDKKHMDDAKRRIDAVLAGPERDLPELRDTMRDLEEAIARSKKRPEVE